MIKELVSSGKTIGYHNGSSSPLNVITPNSVGQLYVQSNGDLWKAIGLSSSNWAVLKSRRLIYTPNTQTLDWSTDIDWGGDFYGDVALEDFQQVDPSLVKTIDFYMDTNKLTAISGLEYYTNLETLEIAAQLVPQSQLQSIAFMMNIPQIFFTGCQLASLDLSKNTLLTTLDCSINELTALDISHNLLLASLQCNANQITTLNLSSHLLLRDIRCGYNLLSTLDVSNNVAATRIWCEGNSLTTLDVSNNPLLTVLSFYNNQLTTLDLSNNPLLINIAGHSNLLTQASVDNILATLVSHGKSTGIVNLSGAGNASPSAAGLASKATLVSRAWNVTTNL